METRFAVEALRDVAALGEDTWLGKLAADGLERQRRNESAEQQARTLMCEPDTDRAWAAFRLLLTVVDRRIACWHERVAAEPLSRSRLTFLDSNSRVVGKAISDNEKAAAGTLWDRRFEKDRSGRGSTTTCLRQTHDG